MIHSEQSGLVQIDARVAGLGLAGALLCELALARLVFNAGERLLLEPAVVPTVLGRRDGLYRDLQAPGEHDPGLPETALELLRLMVAEPQPLPVADWLAFLSQDAYERVAERMLAAGLVRAQRSGLLSRRRAFLPTDVNRSGWVAARLRIQLERGDRFDLVGRVLIGLCLAAGVERRVFDGIRPELVATLAGVRDGLPAALPQLLRRVEVAVAAAVVHRP